MSFVGINLVGLVEKASDSRFEAEFFEEIFKGLNILPILRYETTLAYRNGKKYQDDLVKIPKIGMLGIIKSKVFSRPKAKEVDSSDFLIFDPHFKEVELDGVSYNPIIDPIIEEIQNRNLSVQKVSLLWNNSLPDRRFSFPPNVLSKNDWLPFFLAEFVFSKKDIDELELFISKWSKTVGIDINLSRLKNTIFRISFSKFVFTNILKSRLPKKVLIECYYTPEAMGLLAACKELGIESCDLQHGKQGSHHLMYTHWKNVPNGGFNILPDRFLNWGIESAENITRNSNQKFEEFHKTDVLGFPWLGKNLQINLFQPSIEESEFIEKLGKYLTVVLFSMQPGTVDNDGSIPLDLQNAIEKTRDLSIFWMLRKHPSDQHVEKKYKDLLQQDHVDMNLSSKIPLYSALKNTTHHITKYSSVAFEADAFNIPTYIISDIGSELYRRYVRNEQLFDSSKMTLIDFVTQEQTANKIGYFAKTNFSSLVL